MWLPPVSDHATAQFCWSMEHCIAKYIPQNKLIYSDHFTPGKIKEINYSNWWGSCHWLDFCNWIFISFLIDSHIFTAYLMFRIISFTVTYGVTHVTQVHYRLHIQHTKNAIMFRNRPNLEAVHLVYVKKWMTCVLLTKHTLCKENLSKKITAASEVSLKIQVAASPEILLN